jgi:hypothetical protein
MPRLVACGGREQAFEDFKTALASARKGDRVYLWIDSEDSIADIETTWGRICKSETTGTSLRARRISRCFS